MKQRYAMTYIGSTLYVMTEEMFNHYIPIEVRSAALRLGKAWKRSKEQNRRAKLKYENQIDPGGNNP
jgi:hypothetical protein